MSSRTGWAGSHTSASPTKTSKQVLQTALQPTGSVNLPVLFLLGSCGNLRRRDVNSGRLARPGPADNNFHIAPESIRQELDH